MSSCGKSQLEADTLPQFVEVKLEPTLYAMAEPQELGEVIEEESVRLPELES